MFLIFFFIFSICAHLAEMRADQKDWTIAVELYKEAISLNEKDIKVNF